MLNDTQELGHKKHANGNNKIKEQNVMHRNNKD